MSRIINDHTHHSNTTGLIHLILDGIESWSMLIRLAMSLWALGVRILMLQPESLGLIVKVGLTSPLWGSAYWRRWFRGRHRTSGRWCAEVQVQKLTLILLDRSLLWPWVYVQLNWIGVNNVLDEGPGIVSPCTIKIRSLQSMGTVGLSPEILYQAHSKCEKQDGRTRGCVGMYSV